MERLNNSGFEDEGVRIAIRSRADIASASVQARLRSAARARRTLFCCCSDERLRLFPVEVPFGRGWTLRCGAHESGDHADGCFARLEESAPEIAQRPRVVYAPSILLPPSPAYRRTEREEAAEELRVAGVARLRYGTITHLTQSLLMQAILHAFRDANPAPATFADAGLRNPSQEEVLSNFLVRLSDPVFTDDRSALDCAAQLGLRIYFGITPMPLAAQLSRLDTEDGRVIFTSSGHWGAGGPVLTASEFSIGHRTAQARGGKTNEFDRLISPPYFFLLTATPENEVGRIVLIPLAPTEAALCGSESGPEGVVVSALVRAGFPVLKPIAPVDFGILGPRLWPCSSADGRGYLPRRPDALIFLNGIVLVFQLLGSADDAYLDDVASAQKELEMHLDHPAIRFVNASVNDINHGGIERVLRTIAGTK